jgi:hypothetical protein
MDNKEHILQSKIVIEFSNRRPEERGRLFATFSEIKSPIEGSIKISLGLIKSLPDLIYIRTDGVAIGIELKSIGTRHDRLHLLSQSRLLMSVFKIGFFCDSIDMFWKIIETNSGGIDPNIIIHNLNTVASRSVYWDVVKNANNKVV